MYGSIPGPHSPNKSTGYQIFGCCFVKNLRGYTWCACGIWMISYPVYHSIDLQWDVFPFLTLPPSFMSFHLSPLPPPPPPWELFFRQARFEILHNSLIWRSKLSRGLVNNPTVPGLFSSCHWESQMKLSVLPACFYLTRWIWPNKRRNPRMVSRSFTGRLLALLQYTGQLFEWPDDFSVR